MLHGQASVDVKPGHDVGLAGLGVLQALCDEGRAPFGQQQELLYALEGAGEHRRLGSFREAHLENSLRENSIVLHYDDMWPSA